jgi:hypothetical protein
LARFAKQNSSLIQAVNERAFVLSQRLLIQQPVA